MVKRLLAVFIGLWVCALAASASGISKGPVPAWVQPVHADLTATVPASQIESGYYYILYERQMDVQTATDYIHVLRKIVNQSGIENCSQLEFEYDKAFENVVIHHIHVIRNGLVINQLDVSKFKIVQKAKAMDVLQYNETMSGLLFLEDIKVGDILDYDYSTYTTNPLYTSKFTTDLDEQYGVPISLVSYRIVCPEKRKLFTRQLNNGTAPEEKTENGQHIYTWNLKNLAPLKSEDHLPIGYMEGPVSLVSEYDGWKDVQKWGKDLYAPVMVSGKHIQARAAELAKGYTTDEDKIVRALRFVQDQIRYLGIETGVNTHKPHLPEQVLTQGFGDCKDKAVLLCMLLKEMGIKASPVLIKSNAADNLDERLPSPFRFNHVCVAVDYKGGYRYFDPTISYQRGVFDSTYFPNYKFGIILDDKSEGLTKIPFNNICFHQMLERFEVGDTDATTKLIVTTTYTGGSADKFRESSASGSMATMQREYLTYYQGLYKEVEITDSVKIAEDDSVSNRIVTTEAYTINHFWTHHPGQEHEWIIHFYSDEIKSYLHITKNRKRTMPLSVNYPLNYEQKFEIVMPSEWPMSGQTDVVEDSAFLFTFISSYHASNYTITLDYAINTKTGTCNASYNKHYFDDIDKLSDLLGYSVYINATVDPTKPHPVSIFMLMLLLVAGGITGFICYRVYNICDVTTLYTGDPPADFGGWLILPLIGTVVNPLLLVYFIYHFKYLTDDVIEMMFDKSAITYSPVLGYALVVQLFMFAVLLVMSVLVFVTAFKKRTIFPYAFAAMHLGWLLKNFVNWVMMNSGLIHGLKYNTTADTELWHTALYCAIWVTYMVRSERVKLTFTNVHPSRVVPVVNPELIEPLVIEPEQTEPVDETLDDCPTEEVNDKPDGVE